MSTVHGVRCTRCGKELTAARGLCASCLLRTALSLEEGAAGYRILTVIGGDADAVTYLAEPASGHERFVALKVIGPRRDVDDVLARYARWRPAFDGLGHPAIRRVFGMGQVDASHCYVASEYVTGQSLSPLASHARLTQAQCEDVLAGIRSALAVAHAAGIFHLNLTASRVRVRTAGATAVKVLGFDTRTVIDGAVGRAEDDVTALERIATSLHTLTSSS
jgi:serine/threonine protein kinase